MLSYCYKKYSDNIILHIGTNDKVNEPSNVVVGKLLHLKKLTENALLENNVVTFNVITPSNNGKLLVKIMMVKN